MMQNKGGYITLHWILAEDDTEHVLFLAIGTRLSIDDGLRAVTDNKCHLWNLISPILFYQFHIALVGTIRWIGNVFTCRIDTDDIFGTMIPLSKITCLTACKVKKALISTRECMLNQDLILDDFIMEALQSFYQCNALPRSFSLIILFTNFCFAYAQQCSQFCIRWLLISCTNHAISNRIMNGFPDRIGDLFIIHHALVFNVFARFPCQNGCTNQPLRLIMANTIRNPSPAWFARRIIAHFNNASIGDGLFGALCHCIFLYGVCRGFHGNIAGIRHGILKVRWSE